MKAKKVFADQQKKIVAAQMMALDAKMSKKQEKKVARKLKKASMKKGMDVEDVVTEDVSVLGDITSETTEDTNVDETTNIVDAEKADEATIEQTEEEMATD